MSRTCFVLGCKAKANANQRMHMFRPPKKDLELFRKWETACFRKDKQLTETSVICHKHFPDHQIIKETRILLNDGTIFTSEYRNWKLVKGVVPSLFCNLVEVAPLQQEADSLPPEIPDSQYVVANTVRNADDMFTELCQEGEKFSECNKCDQASQTIAQTTDQSTETVRSPMYNKATQTTGSAARYQVLYERWRQRYRRLKKKHDKKNDKKDPSKSGIFIRYCNLNPRERMYANALARKSNTSKFGMRYEPEHLMEAMLIARKGRKTYNFIRDNGIQVLPTLRTLKKLQKQESSKTALDFDALEMMKKTFATVPENEQFLVLECDEFFLNSTVTPTGGDISHCIVGLDETLPGCESPLQKRLQTTHNSVTSDANS